MQAAALVLEAGGSIATLVERLRPALRAVPHHERDHVGLDVAVMRVLLADVLGRIAQDEADNPGSTTAAEPSESDLHEMGKFFYSAACHEWVLTEP